MKIYRIINGCDPEAITLTPSELRQAYLEAQKEYDMEDMKEYFGYGDLDNMFGHVDGLELINEEEWNTVGISEAVEHYRYAMNQSEEWWYNLRESAEYILKCMVADKKREQEESV